MMRKTYAIIITVIMMIMLSGCDNKTNTTEYENTTTGTTVAEITTTETVTEITTEEITTAAATEETTTEAATEMTTEETVTVENATVDHASADYIQDVTNVQATCETEYKACVVDVHSDHPYDVVWDYGEVYNDLVSECDWSLVFDAEYYKKTFPILALQYNYDDDLLLEHFQTVGIHEGRQGSADFCVNAYLYNCDSSVYNTFKQNFAAYYIYYMLNYDTEKDINTVKAEGKYADKEMQTQLKIILTASQTDEWNAVCAERKSKDIYAYTLDAEDIAFANYRCYINAIDSKDDLKGHEWMDLDYVNLNYVSGLYGKTVQKFSENTVHSDCRLSIPTNAYRHYRNSESHYNAIISEKYQNFGCSNAYNGKNYSCQFEIFTVK